MSFGTKYFKSRLSKFCGRQPLKKLTNFFKGCLPQNLLSPLLNTFSHLFLVFTHLTFNEHINLGPNLSFRGLKQSFGSSMIGLNRVSGQWLHM